MNRIHEMPFGASLSPSGGARFRIWAPAASRVELLLTAAGTEEALSMLRDERGWHERFVPHARSGMRYRYRIDGGLCVPDPASRCNPADVHGPSELVDPRAFEWRDDAWRGLPWEETVIYELHVGTFSTQGTFAGVEARLDHLCALGVTALELMPLADFPGRWGWGYDGVLQFAPEARYGRPDDLKHLIDAAHARGLMMFLDVVYNHFGPDGNYLHVYAPQLFTDRHDTPWGKAIAYDGADAQTVRSFFIHNALYWLAEYRFDGLRLDAVHEIHDDSSPDFLEELAGAVREGPGRSRHVHLVLENDRNSARRLRRTAAGEPFSFTAQWNDDYHHAAHVLLTGERDGYYSDYPEDSIERFARCLAEGFAYQGEPSPFRGGRPRGEPSFALPPAAFVCFLQNHDQVGNRALGERLTALAPQQALETAVSVLLLAPFPPLLFMGEEFGASTPFLFFADFSGDLAHATREGRRREFAGFERFQDAQAVKQIPDPLDALTFERSKLDWSCLADAGHAKWLELYRRLLEIRRMEVLPLLRGMRNAAGSFRTLAPRALSVRWPGEHGALLLSANLGDTPVGGARPAGRVIYGSVEGGRLQPWSVVWSVEPA